MEKSDYFIIAACALFGFFVVNAFLDRFRKVDPDQATRNEDPKQDRASSSQGNNLAWWQVLGVSQDASVNEIKSSFRIEIAKYHPDRVEGLGREIRALAERKAKEVNSAYAAAKKIRNFK